MYFRRPSCRALFALLVFLIPAVSQASLPDTEEDDSTVSFSSNYFADYQVVTLTDMIRLVPSGVNILNNLNNNQQSRGLGASGAQILIDGKRMSGKANDMSTRLSRIQANQVARIDLIRGTAEGLDIRNEGILLNVILKSDIRATQAYLVVLSMLHNTNQQFEPELLLSTSGENEHFEYDWSYNYDLFTRTTDFLEDLMDPNRQIEEVRDSDREFLRKAHIVTANIKYNLDNGDSLRLNGLFKDEDRNEDNLEEQVSFITGELLANEQLFVNRQQQSWEIGGDYETELADFGNLTAVFIHTEKQAERAIVQNQIIANASERLFTFFEDVEESEQILRTNISREIFNEQTFEWGAELAFNELAAYQSFDLSDAEYSNISEDRHEIFFTHSVGLMERMYLQTVLTRESSTIKQSAIGVNNERSFNFWKPRLELRYDVDSLNQIRVVADRSVSQLNLRNFIARRNTEDDTIDFGNPDLIPEKIWQYQVAYEHRFDDDSGAIEIEIFSDKITDFISEARLLDGSSGIGNIGAATRNGINFEANSKLAMFGLHDALLSVAYQRRKTKTVDSFLNLERSINSIPEHYYLFDYRHDLPEFNLVYGLNAHKRSAMSRQDVTLYEVRTNSFHISEIFVEYTVQNDLKLRFEVRNPLQDRKRYDRTFYQDDIAGDIIDRVEYRRSDVRPTYALTAQTTF